MSSDFVFAPGSNEIALALEKLPEGAFKYFAAVFEVSISHVEIQRGIKKRTDSRVYLATFATRLIPALRRHWRPDFSSWCGRLLHASDEAPPDKK